MGEVMHVPSEETLGAVFHYLFLRVEPGILKHIFIYYTQHFLSLILILF